MLFIVLVLRTWHPYYAVSCTYGEGITWHCTWIPTLENGGSSKGGGGNGLSHQLRRGKGEAVLLKCKIFLNQ